MLPGDNLRERKIPLNHGSGLMPALGFGTLIPHPVTTRNATKAALQKGSRLLDTAERYRTEKEVGEAMQEVSAEGKIKRDDLFVITKLWNSNHRPKRVQPALEASLKKPVASTRILRSRPFLKKPSAKSGNESHYESD